MQLTFQFDNKDLKKRIRRLRLSAPEIASDTLNTTLFELKDIFAPEEFSRQLDRPTPFTQNSTRVRKATPQTLNGEIFIAPIAERYLLRQIKGLAADVPIPTRLVKLNKFGNIPGLRGGKIFKRLRASGSINLGGRAAVIEATIDGLRGFWRATPQGLKPLYLFPGPTKVKKRLDFQGGMARWANIRLPRNARREIDRAERKIRRG